MPSAIRANPRVFTYRRWDAIVYGLFGDICTFFVLVTSVLTLVAWTSPEEAGPGWWLAPLMMLQALLLLRLAWVEFLRHGWDRILGDDDGLEWRGAFGPPGRLTWREIVSIEKRLAFAVGSRLT